MTQLSPEEQKQIRLDRMRYTKNTRSSRLALLAIVFDVLYFVSIYSSDVGSWYYSLLIGASIVYNLLFMLMAFLSSASSPTMIYSCLVIITMKSGRIARP